MTSWLLGWLPLEVVLEPPLAVLGLSRSPLPSSVGLGGNWLLVGLHPLVAFVSAWFPPACVWGTVQEAPAHRE